MKKQHILPLGKFTELTRIPEGKYKVAPFWMVWRKRGWLSVTREYSPGGLPVKTRVLWTDSKNDHHPLWNGPARLVEIDAQGHLLGYFEQSLALRLIYGYGRLDRALRSLAHRHTETMARLLQTWNPA